MAIKRQVVAEEDRLTVLLRRRAELYKQEQTIKTDLAEVKEEAVPLMLARGITSFVDEAVGTLTLVEGSNRSISGEKLRVNLLKYLDAADVAEVVDASTTITSYTTMQYKKPKQ